jgi:hypothetical protein
MLVFSHIPRTGGTSLRKFIAERAASHRFMDALSDFAFASDAELMGYEFVATHCGYGVFRRLASARRLIVLRDPVERVISHYHFLRQQDADVSYASPYAKTMSLADFVSQTNPAVSIGFQDTQLWHLIEDKGHAFRQRHAALGDDEKLSLASDNLATFEFVGFNDKLEHVFQRLVDAFGWRDGERPRLATSLRPTMQEVDRDVLALIRSKVSLDEVIYQEARRRYDLGD